MIPRPLNAPVATPTLSWPRLSNLEALVRHLNTRGGCGGAPLTSRRRLHVFLSKRNEQLWVCEELGASSGAAPLLEWFSHGAPVGARRKSRLSRCVPKAASVGLESISELPEDRSRQKGLWARVAPFLPTSLRNQELVIRIFGTIFLAALSRVGVYIPVPGFGAPAALPGRKGAELEAIFGAVDANNIYTLGIGPLVNASWMVSAILFIKQPAHLFRELNEFRQEGRVGANKLKKRMHEIALIFAILAGYKTCWEYRPAALASAALWTPAFFRWAVDKTATLAAGAVLLQFISEQVEEWGLGDGVSLIICLSVLTSYAGTLRNAVKVVVASAVPAWKLGLAAGACVLLVYASVCVIQLERHYPLVYFRSRFKGPESAPGRGGEGDLPELRLSRLGSDVPDQASFIPLRITPRGMSPLLLASFFYYLIPEVFRFIPIPALSSLLMRVFYGPELHIVTYGLVVFFMEAINFMGEMTPREMANWMNTVGAGIKGVSPGEETQEFLIRQQQLTKLWGGALIGILAVSAMLLDSACMQYLGASFSAHMLLLIVGFVTTTQRQVSSLIQMPRLDQALRQERQILQSIVLPPTSPWSAKTTIGRIRQVCIGFTSKADIHSKP